MIELVRARRNPQALAPDFQPSAQAIRNRLRQEGRKRSAVFHEKAGRVNP
jgi:hypothetical protein